MQPTSFPLIVLVGFPEDQVQRTEHLLRKGARTIRVATADRFIAMVQGNIASTVFIVHQAAALSALPALRHNGARSAVVVVPSDIEPDQMLHVLNLGGSVFMPRGTGQSAAPVTHKPWTLTDREIQIVQEISWGRTNKQVADIVGLSAMTVKSHLNRISKKLQVTDRVGVVASCLRAGLIK